MSYGAKAVERLASKIILITGASYGIGAATAREFAAAATGNIKLILTARRKEKLEQLSLSLATIYPGIKIHSEQLDVSKKEAIQPFPEKLPRDFSDIDILVNNAGKALGREVVGEIIELDIADMFSTNVLGLINFTQAVLPIMKRKNSGDIINIGSIAGIEAYPGGSIYCATKSSVRFFTSAWRKELINTKIRVLEVDPGSVETEFSVVRFKGDQKKADATYQGMEPLTAEDIAEIIVFGATRRQNTVIAETLVFPTARLHHSTITEANKT